MTQLATDTETPEHDHDHNHNHDSDLSFGDIVIDRDRSDSESNTDSKAVVVNTPPVTADEWDVYSRGVTVAEDNPQYRSDSAIAIVVFTRDIDSEFRYYSGVAPLTLARLEKAGVNYYAFPQPRLRKVASRGPIEVDINRIQPLRYHSRTFSVSQNEQFVERIAANGEPSPPLVWANPDSTESHTQSDSLTLLDGHKRVWASHVAGLETIQVLGMYLDAETATRVWANRHLGGYDQAELTAAKTRLKDEWGEDSQQFL